MLPTANTMCSTVNSVCRDGADDYLIENDVGYLRGYLLVFVRAQPQTTAVFSMHIVHQLRSPVNRPDSLMARELHKKSVYVLPLTDFHYNIKAKNY
jgi:hypothetical protein